LNFYCELKGIQWDILGKGLLGSELNSRKTNLNEIIGLDGELQQIQQKAIFKGEEDPRL
jgi:hypothetical protein